MACRARPSEHRMMQPEVVAVAEGNGIDHAAIYRLLAQVAATVTGHSAEFQRMDRRMTGLESRLTGLADTVSSLTQEVRDYHGAVMGHGILLTELDERVRR